MIPCALRRAEQKVPQVHDAFLPCRLRRHHRLDRTSASPEAIGPGFAIVLGVGAMVVAPLLDVQPVEADGCAPGWTNVAPYLNTSTGLPGGPTNECELVVTESGDVTIPADIGTVDVLVVGGGGGGGGGTLYPDDALCNFSQGANSDCSRSNFSWAGGGGGGGVEVCKDLDLTGTVTVTVGAGGAGAVAATHPAVTAPKGGDGEATTVDTCTTPGGKGGGSSVSIDGNRQNGSGGAAGNGTEGWPGNSGYPDNGGGGGGADGTPSISSGGSGARPTGGCFSGFSYANWGAGGGGAPGGNNLYWDYAANEGEVFISGAAVNNSFSGGTPAADGPPNSGMGGGGGMQTPPYMGSDAILRAPIAHDGGDGGSGVVIIRYTMAGAPTVADFFPAGGETSGGNTVTIIGSGFTRGPEITIGGVPCTDVVVLSETQITCNSMPAGTGSADVVVTTTGGSSTASRPYCYSTDPDACGGDGGDGSGSGTDGGGSGSGTDGGSGADTTELPATGFDSRLALLGAASVALGALAMVSGTRRRRFDSAR